MQGEGGGGVLMWVKFGKAFGCGGEGSSQSPASSSCWCSIRGTVGGIWVSWLAYWVGKDKCIRKRCTFFLEESGRMGWMCLRLR